MASCQNAQKFTLQTLAVVGFATVFYLVVFGQQSTGRLFVVVLSAAFCALLGNIDRLESFTLSATGLSAIFTKVQVSLEALREMQLAYAKLIFLLAMDPVQFLETHPENHRDSIKQKVIDEARLAGLTESQIREIRDVERSVVLLQYRYAIEGAMYKCLDGRDPNALQHELNTTAKGLLSPSELEDLIQRHGADCDETREFLRDYIHYFKDSDHRRPEVWANRNSWMADRTGGFCSPR